MDQVNSQLYPSSVCRRRRNVKTLRREKVEQIGWVDRGVERRVEVLGRFLGTQLLGDPSCRFDYSICRKTQHPILTTLKIGSSSWSRSITLPPAKGYLYYSLSCSRQSMLPVRVVQEGRRLAIPQTVDRLSSGSWSRNTLDG